MSELQDIASCLHGIKYYLWIISSAVAFWMFMQIVSLVLGLTSKDSEK